jgi:hypothetical protein
VAVLGVLLAVPCAVAQQQGQGQKRSERPPEIEKLVRLAKDPDRLRKALSDPQQVQEMMNLMESDAVREFASDPSRVMELMTEIDPIKIQEVVRSVDPNILRRAALNRYLEQLRKRLDASDEEWAVLAPRLEHLIRAQQEARTGISGMRGGGGGGGGRGGGFFAPSREKPSDLELAAEAVRLAARDPDIPNRDTSLALKEYRKEREKARAKLAAAEQELRDLVTQRQEAILVMLGVLE